MGPEWIGSRGDFSVSRPRASDQNQSVKLLFSEFDPDYSHYRYPYVVWGLPEPGDQPGDIYAAGFHPASPDLDRFALCRHLRVPLPGFIPSSENRRLLRKGEELRVELTPRSDYVEDAGARGRWLAFAEDRFGPGVMSAERLDRLMRGRVVTHLLVFRDPGEGGREVGTVLMYVEPPRMAHYYYAFYDREHRNRSLGLTLMTRAVEHFRSLGFGHLYLGTCYSERALYKAQFHGLQFFNGVDWSDRIEELKFLVRRDARSRHLLEEPEFLAWHEGLEGLRGRTGFGHVVGR